MTSDPSSVSTLPAPSRAAFLLDFDGTLVDIAPTPESVVVADGLTQTLLALRAICGDALGVVSGRPIEQIDHFLPGIPFAVAGEHGIAIRHRPDGPVERTTLPDLPPDWIEQADRLAAAHPGVRIERKKAGLVLHFRAVPDLADRLKAAANAILASGPAGAIPASGPAGAILASNPAGRFHLQPAKMAWEIKPDGVDKETAVRALMLTPPFAGRLPVFVGDDATDEDGIRGARALGGAGFRIPDDFADPATFRAWLARLSATRPGADTWAG